MILDASSLYNYKPAPGLKYLKHQKYRSLSCHHLQMGHNPKYNNNRHVRQLSGLTKFLAGDGTIYPSMHVCNKGWVSGISKIENPYTIPPACDKY